MSILHSLCYLEYSLMNVRTIFVLVPVVARSMVWVCGRLLPGIVVRIPPGAWMSVVSVVCCQVEVSESGWSLVQSSPTDCGVSN